MIRGVMKSCTKCGRSDVVFGKSKKTKDGLRQQCNSCRKVYRSNTSVRQKTYMAEYYVRNQEVFRKNHSAYYTEHKEELNAYCKSYRGRELQENPEKIIFLRTRRRAEDRGIPFDLDLSDMIIPSVCPVLGIVIVCSGGRPRPDSPSVDRMIPSLGYVRGNVRIISNRANTLKSDSTVEEMTMILEDLLRLRACRLP